MTALGALALLFAALAAAAAVAWWRARGQLGAARRAAEARFAEALASSRSQAAAEERERIHADLHDDLGARLLQLVYGATDPAQADLARAALQDLRDVVTRSRGAAGTLAEVVGDIRREATQRLAAAGAVLAWEDLDPLPEDALEPARALHLYRIVREAISNALRHAQARCLRVRTRVRAGQFDFELTDDGAAGPPVEGRGRGMRNMQARAGELQGEIRWLPGTLGGTKVLLSVPLSPEGPAAADAAGASAR